MLPVVALTYRGTGLLGPGVEGPGEASCCQLCFSN
jgi:hypothetical protein